jgi:hypothetical protein
VVGGAIPRRSPLRHLKSTALWVAVPYSEAGILGRFALVFSLLVLVLRKERKIRAEVAYGSKVLPGHSAKKYQAHAISMRAGPG